MGQVPSSRHDKVTKSVEGKPKLILEMNRVGQELTATGKRIGSRGTKAQSSTALPG